MIHFVGALAQSPLLYNNRRRTLSCVPLLLLFNFHTDAKKQNFAGALAQLLQCSIIFHFSNSYLLSFMPEG
jgi:hypothetical protein